MMMMVPPQLCLQTHYWSVIVFIGSVTTPRVVLTLHSNEGQVQNREIKPFHKKEESTVQPPAFKGNITIIP